MKSKAFFLSALISLSPAALAERTYTECQSLKSGPEIAECMQEVIHIKEAEIRQLMLRMKNEFVEQETIINVTVAQEYWSHYSVFECKSRSRPKADGHTNGTNYGSCIYRKLEERVEELKRWHYCEDNGCPERKK